MNIYLENLKIYRHLETNETVLVAEGDWSYKDFLASFKTYRTNKITYVTRVTYMGKELESRLNFLIGYKLSELRMRTEGVSYWDKYIRTAATNAVKLAFEDYYNIDDEALKNM